MEFIDLKTQYSKLRETVNARIQAVLDHGQYIMGPEVAELETKLAQFASVQHCITVSSGTEALLIALMALGVGPGDEVITTPFTFAATAEVIALVGATPVFVDIEPDTCNLDVALVGAAITSRTKAIIPVSLYGQVADMDELNALAAEHGIAVIEDAAQSFGATYRDRRSCGTSQIGCASFFPSKPLGCYGDGGAIFTNSDELARIARQIRVHGQEKRYYHARIGVGGRMDTLQCAVVLAKLECFDWEIEQRLLAGQRYMAMMSGSNSIALPVVRPDRNCVWAQFTVQVSNRDAVVDALKQAGIPTAVHYPIPLHWQPAYKDISRISGSLDNAERVAAQVLSLPMHPYIDEATQREIVDALLAAAHRPSAGTGPKRN
ncbi:MAG: DegT/DnrJ/EryC1/StrS family aminotransferase [Alphaproteobacteria bacterium]|nr:DegT/DnrJ/EryC1/StrS family aminotransferase [Alphaproteobacteria bacterium]